MKTILIIEDNKEVRENATEILELSGYQVEAASNGKDGVALAQSLSPDLIICDVMMPGVDGYGVLHMLRRNTATLHTPFIFITARTEKADVRKGMELGADDYLTKPFDGIELLNAVDVRLQKAESLRRIYSQEPYHHEELKAAEPELALTSREREIQNFQKKQLLYREGDRPRMLYYIINGRVKIYKNHHAGKTLITQVAGPGEFLGYVPILEETVYPDNAEILEDAEIMLIPGTEFQQIMKGVSPVAGQFMKLMARHLSEKEEAMVQMAYNSLRKKVAFAILQLLDKNDHSTTDRPTLSMSREDLANTIGIATESLIRTLAEFKTEGMVDLEKGRVIIINEKKLRNFPF